ncbi:MAG TPA: condensation domain-containing protein, partial [Clostridia bacterium]|nr:condensation domain-containing protein [Clostridia bacterium]
MLTADDRSGLPTGGVAPGPEDLVQGAVGVFPLSFMQESLWVVEEMAPESSAYNMAEAWRLEGQLDRAVLERCWNEVLHRHEILRTCIRAREGSPRQVILPAKPVSLPITDLRASENQEAELVELMRMDIEKPFVLSSGPLWRVRLFVISPEEHVLLINLHHIICDAWSQQLLLREITELYAAFREDKPSPLPELPVQYADFSVWQRERLDVSAQHGQLEYWKRQLSQPLAQINLAADYPRQPGLSAPGKTDFVTLPAGLIADLKQLSREQGATLFTVLLSAFKTWLHRCTGEEDVIVGSPFSARQRVETEPLIGFFVNTHALRTWLGGNPTFVELLGRVRETVLGAANAQEVPLGLLLANVKPQRQAGSHPLFQVVFGLQSGIADRCSWPGVQVERLELASGAAKFDWTLLASETPEGLRIRSEYNSARFQPETAARFLRSFHTLLHSIVRAPHARISDLPLVTEEERSQLFFEWNRTQTDYPRGQSVPAIFERQVQKRPEAVALELQGQLVTYGELNERANRLAGRLRGFGIGRGSLVGLGAQRSIEMIVGMLGILK